MARRLYHVVQIRLEIRRGREIELVDIATDPLPRAQALVECDAERARNDDPLREFFIRDAGILDWSREMPRSSGRAW